MLLDNRMKLQGPPEVYDNTMKSYFTKCPRQFYWWWRGLELKETPAYFTFGRAFGAFCNEFHRLQGKMKNAERLATAIAEAELLWDKENPLESGSDSLENLREVFKRYVEVYGYNEPWTMVYKRGELGFQLPIPQTTILYGGSIDAPIEWRPYGLLPREDKTTGFYLTNDYLHQWDFSTQVTGYIWAMRQVLGEEPFGAYMNIGGKRKRKEPSQQFMRYLTKRDEGQIQNWIKDTVLIIDSIRVEWERWKWPRLGMQDPINCVGGAGRKACTYKNLCLRPMEPWDYEETHDFSGEFNIREERWKPWERNGEG